MNYLNKCLNIVFLKQNLSHIFKKKNYYFRSWEKVIVFIIRG